MTHLRRQDVGIIILAAGFSHRFGDDKRLAPLDNGRSLLEATLDRVPDTFTRRVLVLHEGDDMIAARHGKDGWICCMAADASRGMGHSLTAGIEQAGDWQGALIGLGDMPFIEPSTYELLQAALCRHEIVAPFHQGRRGNPVGFRKVFFSQLRQVEGDTGAREILAAHADQCYRVETDDPGILRDVDRPDDLQTGRG